MPSSLRREEIIIEPAEEVSGCTRLDDEVTPKSPIGTALSYSMKRWQELTVFITDGRLEIDNNKIENEIRLVALGRRNFLFAGSHESAQRIAMVYSLRASCKVNEVDPTQWLIKVLEELPNRSVNNIEDLLPQKVRPHLVGCLPSILLTVSMGTPFVKVTVVANVQAPRK